MKTTQLPSRHAEGKSFTPGQVCHVTCGLPPVKRSLPLTSPLVKTHTKHNTRCISVNYSDLHFCSPLRDTDIRLELAV